ncbi:MAG: ethanolamine utilization protein [Proteobacteria bacterium]|nr:ethanolamine utilization protein [Pseudomonadota bacterium]
MPTLLDQPIACVDLETTGGNALYNRVIEVGVVLMEGGEVVEEWSSLVNPGCRIPRNIEEFTGISNDMVAGAPDFAALGRDVLGRLEGRLFVAHNARFDYGFLRSEFRRLDVRFRSPVLCTVKLSRRLYPGTHGHNLDAVMERHGLSCSARHRALGDAQVLAALLAQLRQRRDPGELDAVVAGLVQETSLPPQLDAGLADELPEGPGVYRFYGEGGALLYVGKSKNLRARILAHFAGEHRSGKDLKLSRQVRQVEWTETAGEIGALLREARCVKELEPLYNRRLRASPQSWTLVLRGEEDLRAEIVPLDAVTADAGACHGVFRSRGDARKALEELVRGHDLCLRVLGLEDGEGSCFAFQVGRCRGACCGREPLALHAVRVRLAFARHKLRDWPFAGRMGIRERDWRGHEEVHVFDRWRYLGTVLPGQESDPLAEADAAAFDIDCYRILCRLLDRPPARVQWLEMDRP